MQEIEIKAVLKNREGIMEKLRALGCEFSIPVRQEDVIYVKTMGSLEVFLANPAFLRIRAAGDKVLLTAKRRGKVALAAIEHEVEVDSKEEAEKILALIEYEKAVEINKMRVTTEYDGCEICIDEVEGLGSFIEMEKLSIDGDPEKIQEELFQFFETLGISREDRVNKGYDILMLEKKEGKLMA